jgi:hypothetical protein
MSLDDLRFSSTLQAKPLPRGFAVETSLDHFSIVTYLVNSSRLRELVHPRFAIDEVQDQDGVMRGLVSAVTFHDRDFRLAACPWPRFQFGQTNYRSYVTDTETGEHVAWFFGTSLASWSVAVPRFLWKLPWHGARIDFDCDYDEVSARYKSYRVSTKSQWAPAELALIDSGEPPSSLIGFSSVEAGLVLLTQPSRGFYYLRNGALGSYSIWHDRMTPTMGEAASTTNHPVLERLGLIQIGDAAAIHSVLIQRSIDFTIYLPPKSV